jgi:regulatory protein
MSSLHRAATSWSLVRPVATEPAPRRSRRPEAVAERRAARAGIEDVGKVVEYAAWLLESRSRSVAELRRKLVVAGFRPALIDEAIGRLTELGFLDDEAFASAWVESRDRARPRGEHALRRELALKGIDRGVIDGVLATRRGEVEDPDDPFHAPVTEDPDRVAAASLLERRRAALLRETDPRKRRAKAYALLARNGFAPDVASELSRRIDGDQEDGSVVLE